MRAVILAGGRGTRLAPYTWLFPKPLVPLGNKPVAEIIVRQLARQGFDRITMAIGHLGELIMAYFGNGKRFGVEIDYSVEDRPLGTAGPLTLMKDLEEDFLVMNGDVVTTLNFRELMAFHAEKRSAATIAMYRKDVKLQLGVLVTNGSQEVTDYVEKPTLDYQVSMGVYAFSRSVLELMPPGAHMDFPTLILKLIEERRPVLAYTFRDYWADIGTHDEYETAVREYEAMEERLLGGELTEDDRTARYIGKTGALKQGRVRPDAGRAERKQASTANR